MSPLNSHYQHLASSNGMNRNYHDHITTACFSHKSKPVRTTTDTSEWRWKCCNCDAGGNNSFEYNARCTDCGHGRCAECSTWKPK
ncbi:uncharacterized protein F4812DRAFT_408317 [Daldinia caldariorum]|uniref:uncharacterized protein n=1 Tax=Daldinia caldariorum TaxID=326644 RepID=UPI002007D684|nr:uncharacterized protein F4812DRAFT_408317 [Daldinia caldariorum]KAI1472302.1 hypothetical protein F4812DRAFT_408317 [Daldinia caldariorum]